MVELIVIIILLKISQLNLNYLCIVVLWATPNIAATFLMLWDEVQTDFTTSIWCIKIQNGITQYHYTLMMKCPNYRW